MKLKEMWKRFWTLDVHNHEGFTLVELIIVIAILAILSTGAIAGYSVYIKQANMTADRALVSEISNALILYHYSNPGVDSSFVVLVPDGLADADESAAAAMQAAYGADWQKMLQLKYSGWVNNDGKNGNVSKIALLQALELNKEGLAGVVGNSSFITGSTPVELMTNVTTLTSVATGLFDGMNDAIKYSTIKNNLFSGSDDLLKQYCNEFGITVGSDAAGDFVFGQDVTNEQLSNLLVFGAAQQITAGGEPSTVVSLVYDYAAYAGFMNSVKGTADEKAVQTAYTKLNEELGTDNNNDGKINSDDITIALTNFQNTPSFSEKLSAYKQDDNKKYNDDMTAFISIMGAVDEASGTVTPEEMKSDKFFQSDKVSGFFGTYLNAAEAASKMTKAQIEAALAAIDAGGIVITMSKGTVSDSAGILQKGN